MTSNNLPRLENSAFNRNAVIGFVQIATGILGALSGAVLLIFYFIVNQGMAMSGTPLAVMLWLTLVVSVWFFAAGLNRLTVNSTFRRLHPRLMGGQFTLGKLAELMGTTPTRLLSDLADMNQRKYWEDITVLDDALVITPYPDGNPRHYRILADDGMRFEQIRQGNAIPQTAIIVFLAGLFILMPLPFPNLLWVAVAVVLSFPVHHATRLFMPKRQTARYKAAPTYVPETIELTLSGDEQADALISQAETHLEQLDELERTLSDADLKARVHQLSLGTQQMVEQLQKYPQKHRQARQTLEYSLPTAIELFYQYRELDKMPVKGENIQRSMAKIHEMSDFVAETFRRELDALYQDQTLDIEVDIEVMRQMLTQEHIHLSHLADDPSPSPPEDNA